MGGKRLKFPNRQKYVAPSKEGEIFKKEEELISEEEKKKRLEHLKALGLLK